MENDHQRILLEDWQGQHFELMASDLLQGEADKVTKRKVMLGSLVKYKDHWYPNGGVSWLKQEDRFLKYREQKQSAQKQKELITDKVLRLNQNCPFLFFEDYSAMKKWIGENLKDEFQNTDTPELSEAHEQEKNLVAFVSPETGFLVLPGGACCVCHPDNPYYQADEAGAYAIKVLFDPHYSASEMVRCLVRERLLPDAALFSEISEERGKQLLQDNLDFLLRVIRPDF